MRRLPFPIGALVLVVACTSSSSNAPDASTGIAGDDDDASAFDAGAPPSCPILQDWENACAPSDPCAALIASRCNQFDLQMSEAAKVALTTCYAYGASSCASDAGESSVELVSDCFQQQMANATPTAAQSKLASDFCAACAPSDASCGAAFYATSGAIDSSLAGLGAAYLMMNDATVARIDAACAQAADAGDAGGSCAESFDACATNLYASSFPSLACPVDGGGP